MHLTDWMDDEFFGRGKVRYLKSYNGEPYREITERFFYTYVLCVAFVKKTEDGRYMVFVKERSDGRSGFKAISDSEEAALLRADVMLLTFGYKINNIGL